MPRRDPSQCLPSPVPPYATSLPDESSVRAGETVQLQCLAHGTPPLRYQWDKVNGLLPDHAVLRDSVLRISPAQPEDAGAYRCVVSNRVGSAETIARVSVQGEHLSWGLRLLLCPGEGAGTRSGPWGDASRLLGSEPQGEGGSRPWYRQCWRMGGKGAGGQDLQSGGERMVTAAPSPAPTRHEQTPGKCPADPRHEMGWKDTAASGFVRLGFPLQSPHTHVHSHVHVNTHAYMHSHAYVGTWCTRAFMHTCKHEFMHAHMHTRSCVCKNVHMHA